MKYEMFKTFLSATNGFLSTLLLLRVLHLDGVELIITVIIVVVIVIWIRTLWLDKLIRRDKNDKIRF